MTTLATATAPPGAPPRAPVVRIASLDGLRGLAILMVLVMHYYVIVPAPDGFALHAVVKRACSLFFTGVDLFFVLSGFLIGGILLDHREAPALMPAFYARRFFRIVPLYALLLATYFAGRAAPGLAALSGGSYFFSPVPLASYCTMLQNIAMSWTQNVGNYWLSPTWSLGIEEQFYLLAPFAVRYFSRRALSYVCILALVACPMLRLAALLFSGNSVAATFLLPMRADSLLAGILCAVIVRDTAACDALRRHRTLLAALCGSFLLFLALLATRGLSTGAPLMVAVGYSLVTPLFAGAVLWVSLFPAGGVARLMSFRPLGAIGLVSYFAYLFHTPMLFTVHWAVRGLPPLHHDWTGGGITLLALAATFALAAISWRWFETPLLKLGRRVAYA